MLASAISHLSALGYPHQFGVVKQLHARHMFLQFGDLGSLHVAVGYLGNFGRRARGNIAGEDSSRDCGHDDVAARHRFHGSYVVGKEAVCAELRMSQVNKPRKAIASIVFELRMTSSTLLVPAVLQGLDA